MPDGPLLDLAFAALLDGRGHRLIERFPLSRCIALGVLSWPDVTARATTTLLCVADPLGERKEGMASPSRGRLGPLPYSRQEGQQVLKLFANGKGLLGAEARPSVVRQEMPGSAVLHFATHSLLDAQDGLRSGLVLAPEAADSVAYAVLEARDVACMRLAAARMAVLSACATAQGQESGGEGLLGLAWAFRAAGCPAIVASQWRVDDQATAQLMTAFYAALRVGLTKDVALQRAMLQVKRDTLHTAPYYWSAFELIGDTSPLPPDLLFEPNRLVEPNELKPH